MASSSVSLDMLSPREHIEKIRRDRFYIGKEEKNPLAEDMHLAVKYLSEELYSKDVHFLMELIQNAEDNEYPSDVTPSLDFIVTSKDITATGAASTLLIFNNEKGFSPANIESICRVGKSMKKGLRDHGYIGEKGIGFKSVFLVSSQPHIFSNGYQIKFSEEPSPECEIGYIVPEWVEEHPTVFDLKEIYGSTKVLPTTTIILPLKSEKVPALHILDKFYEEDLLRFFSVAFDVRDKPDVEDYMKLWEQWEQSTTSQVSLDDCLVFWEFIGMHWNVNCEKLLAEHVRKLPILIGDGISLISKLDLFIPDDLLLADLFDEPLFVWYPTKSTPSLTRSKLTHIYTCLGVRKFSEVVEKHESYVSDSQVSDVTKVESTANVVKEGLLRIILAFLANPCLDICAKERHDMVKSLLDLTIIEADEPVNMQYKITFSGGRKLQAKMIRLFRWERNESRLYMRRVANVKEMEGRIRYATYLSEEISRGLLYDRADLVESLAELLKFGCLLDYEIAAVGFLLKNKNLQVFAEDEEFLSLHIHKGSP